MRLSYSRMPIVRAYPRETQEMVFDAHDKAFAFYGGVCRRGIYDNMKTAVETVFVGRAREYNRRFLNYARTIWSNRSPARRALGSPARWSASAQAPGRRCQSKFSGCPGRVSLGA